MSESEEDDWFTKDITDLIKIDQTKSVENKFMEEEVEEQKDERSSLNTNCYESTSSKEGFKRTLKSDGINYCQAISLGKLVEISKYTTLDIFLELSLFHEDFLETIRRSNNSNKVFEALLKIIAKFCEIPLAENKKDILTKICETKVFWKQIILYCRGRETDKKPKNKKKNIVQKCFGEVLADLFVFCKSVEKILKLKFLNELCEILKVSKEVENFGEVLISFEDLRSRLESSEIKEFEDIYPTLDDIHKDTVITPLHLKANITEGRYLDVRSYLDVHLSLIREDLIAPLRDAIKEYKISTADKNSNIYPKVRLVLTENLNSLKNQKGHIHYLVDLEPDSRDLPESILKNTIQNRVQSTKKFIVGSLLCFSTNSQFTDLILGVVSNQHEKLLNQGFIQVELVNVSNTAINIFDVDLILMKSEIFIESYSHVYRVLKELNEDNFPMKKYFIENFSSPEYPSYISDDPKVLYNYKDISFNLKDIATGQQKLLVNLNQKQYEAFHAALTRKFCVIQGASDTGKTFIGLEIISALLQNTKEQILIICYTNRSLDQFLTGILKYTDNMVRMGKQSKDKDLIPFTMKKVLENSVIDNSDERFRAWYRNTRQEYSSLMNSFERLQNNFKICEDHEKGKLLEEIFKIQNQLKSTSIRLDEFRDIENFNLIKNKRIIGMTTTYAAKCHGLLQLLKTPIVIVDEAGEILESHIVTALSSHTQQLILIGDKQQLPQSSSVYKIAKKYKMDISLFERMIKNGINSTILTIQDRMRHKMLRFVRSATNPDLEKSDGAQRSSNVKGMMNDLFFIDHNDFEDKCKKVTKKSSSNESQYLIGLCNYLILQGYTSDDITILTTNNSENNSKMNRNLIREREKHPELKNISIKVVHNYKGEQSKIILLSIENNSENINRLCVAMSRAQKGFYIIGNMTALCNTDDVWKTLRKEFEDQNCIGNELSVKCHEHGTISKITTPNDFDSFSANGCHQSCESKK